MKRISTLVVAGLAASILVVGLSACEKKEGPAERAGKEIDKAVEKSGQEVNKAVEKAGEQVEKAGQQIQGAAKDAKK